MSRRRLAIATACFVALVTLLYIFAVFPWLQCAFEADTEVVGGPRTGVCVSDSGFVHRYATHMDQVAWSEVGALSQGEGPDGEPIIVVSRCGHAGPADPGTQAGWALLGLQPRAVTRAMELMSTRWGEAGGCTTID